MDGILLIDKPSGMTSHDVVAWARRTLHERRIGHAGTLDPMATGLLVLLVGQATRLSQFLTGKAKTYDALVRLGQATTTDDADGEPVGEAAADLPSDSDIRDALGSFVGVLSQLPPAHSAKKIAGTPAYVHARRAEPVALKAVDVTAHAIEWHGRTGDAVRLRVSVSAGFYVRALARDLGTRLGCGAHLAGLRRLTSGTFDVSDALSIGAADGLGQALSERLVSPAAALPEMPVVEVTGEALARARHGNWLGPDHVSPTAIQANSGDSVRVVTADGQLVALAEYRAGALHPVVVLG